MTTATRHDVAPPEERVGEIAVGSQTDEILDRQTEQIADRAADVGSERLDRSGLDILITGFIGGVEVSIGALAAMLVVGAALVTFPGLDLYAALALGGLVFPVGFLFVILGRSELFTENFLIPVASVFTRQATWQSLIKLWALSLAGNVLGCGALAALMSLPHALGAPILRGFLAYSAYKLQLEPEGVFVSAILAGLVMTVLTWLVVAVRHPVAKILVIWAAGYTLFAANLSHVVVTSAIMFVGFGPAGYGLWDVLSWMGIATAGNLIGGVAFVTVFRLAQVREKQRSTSKESI